jgi:hypothetical protein
VFGLKLSLGLDKIRAKRLEKKKQIFFSLAIPQENILALPSYLKYLNNIFFHCKSGTLCAQR